MCANVRRMCSTLKVHHLSSSMLSSFELRTSNFSRTLNLSTFPQFTGTLNHYPSPSTDCNKFDYLNQFVPFGNSVSSSLVLINSNERQKIVVGLSKVVKKGEAYVLKGFSQNFCPYFLVKIMKLLETRETAFAFFKLAFYDDSESTIKSCCIAAHILAAEDLRFLAQDVVSWVMSGIGVSRSKHLVEFMWGGHHQYESDFQVLDNRMCGFWPNLPLWQIRL